MAKSGTLMAKSGTFMAKSGITRQVMTGDFLFLTGDCQEFATDKFCGLTNGHVLESRGDVSTESKNKPI